jgi:hypothetical protein
MIIAIPTDHELPASNSFRRKGAGRSRCPVEKEPGLNRRLFVSSATSSPSSSIYWIMSQGSALSRGIRAPSCIRNRRRKLILDKHFFPSVNNLTPLDQPLNYFTRAWADGMSM